jgi:hypothetical protein
MAGGTEQSQRRLSAAAYKIEQFLHHLDKVAAGGFPHKDGETAIEDIREVFLKLRKTIKGIPAEADASLVVQYFREVRDQVAIYTRVLGIILRSTNLRNNFEVYSPLKRLACNFLGSDVRLLISSEWEFIPFTYPMNIKEVPNLILVGSPASEAQNLLVTPLAGHEIGHSVWASNRVIEDLKGKFSTAVKKYYSNVSETASKKGEVKDDLFADVDQTFVESLLQRKSEEVFCDLLGLRTFGASYLLAFEYYMAPGKSRVSRDYPSDICRLRLLQSYAHRNGIVAPSGVFEGWEEPGRQTLRDQRLYQISDEILISLAPDIEECVNDVVKKAQIATPDSERVKTIKACFERFEPFGEYSEYVEVINALWEIANDLDLRHQHDPQKLTHLTELALKSIEVSEISYKKEEFERGETIAEC